MTEKIKKLRERCRHGYCFYMAKGQYYDYGLIFIILFLLAFGFVMVYSTTSYSDSLTYDTGAFFSTGKQMKAAALGIIAMVLVSKMNYHLFVNLSYYAMAVIVVICVAVLLIGSSGNGATRWFGIGGVSFQPSELMKPAMILFITKKITENYLRYTGARWKNIWYVFLALLGVLVLALPVIMENLSTGIIICMIAYFLFNIANKKNGVFWIGIFIGVLLLVIGWQTGVIQHGLKTYQVKRVTAWLDPLASQDDASYQILQGLYAIGSGGLFGKGLGSSVQKLGFLPEAQNDMIFGIICEELGVFGAFFLIMLYVFLIARLLYITTNAPDMQGGLVTAGIMIHMSIQVIMNIAVVTNSMPNTGVTLPFISYGGTALVVTLAEMGLALSVSNQIKDEK